jgi:proton glutamate symport protein
MHSKIINRELTGSNSQSSWYRKLHWQILVGMLIGAAVGVPLNIASSYGLVEQSVVEVVASVGAELGGVFLKLLKMIVVPLVVASLVSGLTSTSSLKGLGRLGLRTMAYYLTTSMLAIIVGLTLVNLIEPGAGVDQFTLGGNPAESQNGIVDTVQNQDSLGKVIWQMLLRLIPENPLRSMVEGDMLPIIFFSLLIGVFITLVGGKAAERLTDLFKAFFEVMMAMTLFVLRLAPVGVMGFVLNASATQGMNLLQALGWYMITVMIALLIHAVITLPVLVRLLARRSAIAHARDMAPALLTAFSTASSNGTLPLTINCVEQRAGVSNRTSSFVLPLGATINMDGTALYEAVAVLFIAQVYGIDLGPSQQIIVAVTALLVSIGAAAIPHAGLVMMVIVLNAVGLPTEAVGIIIAVDRVLDMCRTCVNVWSDSIAAIVIDRHS